MESGVEFHSQILGVNNLKWPLILNIYGTAFLYRIVFMCTFLLTELCMEKSVWNWNGRVEAWALKSLAAHVYSHLFSFPLAADWDAAMVAIYRWIISSSISNLQTPFQCYEKSISYAFVSVSIFIWILIFSCSCHLLSRSFSLGSLFPSCL